MIEGGKPNADVKAGVEHGRAHTFYQSRRIFFSLLVMVVIGIGLLHFFTPGHLVFYHDTYRRLSYFPIVIGALFFGLRGGLVLSFLSSIAFIPHLLLYFGHAPATYLSELTEIILYLAAGTVTGIISGRESRLRENYRQLSAKLEKSYDQLHRETELLLEVEEQLSVSQKLSALGELSASLAHEIKNPLSSIRGTAEILLDEFPHGHEKREFAEILLKEAERLNNTVNEVLQYSKGRKSGGADGESLAVVLERIGRLLESRLRQKQIDYSVSVLEPAGNHQVDGGKISQVFLNLILNSIDAVPPHGLIRLKARPVENGVAVTVADNGPGIPASEREKVFQPFVTGKDGGTGLGLAISRKIVKSHGGRITVAESEEGGALFEVFLPTGG